MLSVKLITPKSINVLCGPKGILSILFSILVIGANAQDNSPYSRFGIGDLTPSTSIIGRGMGSLSAGYVDFLSINFNNPASYSSFQSLIEAKSKKTSSGRAILDIGVNLDTRTLQEPFPVKRFVASNALFSYMQVGVPLKNGWGFSFGLRPISRISYNIFRSEKLFDPGTGLPIDTAITRFQGDGGTYLASMGTGFNIFRKMNPLGEEKLSFGINGGFLFGKKNYSTKRALINDTVDYYMANYQTQSTFGNPYFSAGIQYKTPLKKDIMLVVGAYGNLKQNLRANKDELRETFVEDPNFGTLRLDSVSDKRDVKGKLVYPMSFTVGFIIEKMQGPKTPGWLLGLDFMHQTWSQYRFYGQPDSVKDNWEIRGGGQLRPVSRKNYFSNVAYRAGFMVGPDYIKVGKKLMQYGLSFGLGLPIPTSRQAPNQASIINLAFEYSRRGNNNNLLRESIFRISLGFSLSDFWFIKRKYE
ncbi:MAG TPA: hypothetical protein VLJ68_01945 [Chitinophagaceae bacterium]|nr:hypothetical protein [Chitinophagaceae bacterium]